MQTNKDNVKFTSGKMLDSSSVTRLLNLQSGDAVISFNVSSYTKDNSKAYSIAISLALDENNLILNVSNHDLKGLNQISEDRINQIQKLEAQKQLAIDSMQQLDALLRNDSSVTGSSNIINDSIVNQPNKTFDEYLSLRKAAIGVQNTAGSDDREKQLKEYLNQIPQNRIPTNSKFADYKTHTNTMQNCIKEIGAIEHAPVSNHIISLNRFPNKVNNGQGNLYIITDTAGYNNAHKLIEQQIKANEPKAEFIVIPNAYHNGNNDCSINANINAYIIPKLVEHLESKGQKIDANNLTPLIAKFRPTPEIINNVRMCDHLRERHGEINTRLDKLPSTKQYSEIQRLNTEIDKLNTEIDKLNTEIDKLKQEIPTSVKNFVDAKMQTIKNPPKINFNGKLEDNINALKYLIKNDNSSSEKKEIWENTLKELQGFTKLPDKEKKLDQEEALTVMQVCLESLKPQVQTNLTVAIKSEKTIPEEVIESQKNRLKYWKNKLEQNKSQKGPSRFG